MKTLFILTLFSLLSFCAFAEEELSTSKIYAGKFISYCGRIDSIGSASTTEDGKRIENASLIFRVVKPEASFTLYFQIPKTLAEQEGFMPGSFVSASGICYSHSFINGNSSGSDGKRLFVNIHVVRGATVKDASKGFPEGFACIEQDEGEASLSSAGSKSGASGGESSEQKRLNKASESNFEVAFDEKEAMKSIVIAKGGKGSGSAFIAKLNDKKYLITNIHVVFNDEPKFFSLMNERIEVLDPSFSNDRDLAFYELKEPDKFPALDVEENISELPPEQPVIVFGNSLGAGVNTRLKGRIKGVGPTTLEISAEIVPGNSGSPILDASSGKVVGVSTYGSQTRKADFSIKGTRFEDVRRFGTRLDTASLAALEPFDKRKYAADVKLYSTVASANQLGLALLTDLCEQRNGRFSPVLEPHNYDFSKYVSLNRVIQEWNDIMNNRTPVKIANLPTVLQRLKNQISAPVANIKKQAASYSWVRNSIEKELEINDYYCKSFDSIRKDIEEYVRH